MIADLSLPTKPPCACTSITMTVLHAHAYGRRLGKAFQPDGAAADAGVVSVCSERGGLTACRGIGHSAATGKPPVGSPLGQQCGPCSWRLQ